MNFWHHRGTTPSINVYFCNIADLKITLRNKLRKPSKWNTKGRRNVSGTLLSSVTLALILHGYKERAGLLFGFFSLSLIPAIICIVSMKHLWGSPQCGETVLSIMDAIVHIDLLCISSGCRDIKDIWPKLHMCALIGCRRGDLLGGREREGKGRMGERKGKKGIRERERETAFPLACACSVTWEFSMSALHHSANSRLGPNAPP